MQNKVIEDLTLGFPDIIKKLDIFKGDTLLVSSDVSRLFYIEYQRTGELPNLDLLVDALKEAVGEDGTLIFPTFTWDFCKRLPFNIRESPCKTGSLSNVTLNRLDFKRTKHPIYSFTVWGKDTDYLCSMENVASFGEGTPFEYFVEHRAKNLLIDVTLTQGYTFVHHCEQVGKASYRFHKKFKSEYVDCDGNHSVREYTMFVRKLALNPLEDFTEMENNFLTKGIERRIIINGINFSIVNMSASFPLILEDVVNNRSRKIYKYRGQN